jgi:hypothetical protein
MWIYFNQTDTFIAIDAKDIKILWVGSQTYEGWFIKVYFRLFDQNLIELHHTHSLDLILRLESLLEIKSSLPRSYCRIHLVTLKVIFWASIIRWKNCIRFIIFSFIFIPLCDRILKEIWVIDWFFIVLRFIEEGLRFMFFLPLSHFFASILPTCLF